MFAIDYLTGHPNLVLNASSLDIKVFVNTLEGTNIKNRVETNMTINMEQCTPRHFAMFDDINFKFNMWGASNWLCPPLDQRYTI